MQGDRIENRSGISIRGCEGTRRRIHVSGAQVIQAGVYIVLLAGIEEVVCGGAGFCKELSGIVSCPSQDPTTDDPPVSP